MSGLVHLVADYGSGDPAFSEVVHRLRDEVAEAQVQTTAVPRFSTVATGFWVEQLAVNSPELDECVVFANTAPRLQDSPRPENRGDRLLIAQLENGNPVVSVNSGHSLSFVRESIKHLHSANVKNGGSQFRSRDFYPEAVASVLRGESAALGEQREISSIPEPPESSVAFVDGYGNIKTTVRASEFDFVEGDEIEVEIDGERARGLYRENTFEVENGEVSIAPGSSGGEDPYIEIFLRGGSAAEKFFSPEPGQKIKFNGL